MENNIFELMDSLDDLFEDCTSGDFTSETDLNQELESPLICECFCVGQEVVSSMVKQLKFEEEVLHKLKKEYGLGEGCGSCLKNKDQWLKKII